VVVWFSVVRVVVYEFVIWKSSVYVGGRLVFVEFSFLYECDVWVIVVCL
jgi:hypothetical protein